MQQTDLLRLFAGPLENAGLEYMVTGSVAAIIYGVPRFTNDIDVVIHLPISNVDEFCRLFPLEEFYCPPAEVIRTEASRKARAHFNLIHHDTGLKADCYPVGNDSLHAWALGRRRRIPISDVLTVTLAPPEYVIVRKLEYYREGGSQKHLDDIRNMLAVSSETIDQQQIAEFVAARGLATFWLLVADR
jgi:hypothetical protein